MLPWDSESWVPIPDLPQLGDPMWVILPPFVISEMKGWDQMVMKSASNFKVSFCGLLLYKKNRRKKEHKGQLMFTIYFFSCFSVDNNSRNEWTDQLKIYQGAKYILLDQLPSEATVSPGRTHTWLFSETRAQLESACVILITECLLVTKTGELKSPMHIKTRKAVPWAASPWITWKHS